MIQSFIRCIHTLWLYWIASNTLVIMDTSNERLKGKIMLHVHSIACLHNGCRGSKTYTGLKVSKKAKRACAPKLRRSTVS